MVVCIVHRDIVRCVDMGVRGERENVRFDRFVIPDHNILRSILLMVISVMLLILFFLTHIMDRAVIPDEWLPTMCAF